MTDRLTISAEDLKRFAPKAKQEYVTALLGNLYLLQTNGILDNSYRLCHFMAQIAHETGGFTILREDLSYKSAARLRQVWPARFRSKTDAELKPLLRDPRKLGDAVYAGRMGNTQPGTATITAVAASCRPPARGREALLRALGARPVAKPS